MAGLRITWILKPTFWGLLMVFILLLTTLPTTDSIQWLTIAKGSHHWNRTKDCTRARKDGAMIKQQVVLCRRNLELMPIVSLAGRETMKVCRELFSDRRWNCSSVNHAPNYMADLTGGGREQAYVFALSAAALMQATARACSLGATTKCGCGRLPNEPPPGDFKWGGCGDDLVFGQTFSQAFADSPFLKRKRRSKAAEVNLHNAETGRVIVSGSLQTACKCHGVSGSCSIKTCWKALPDLRTIGLIIQKRYALAVEVESKRMGKNSKNPKKRVLVPSTLNKNSFEEDELIYFRKSPDYCLADESVGSMGTTGRECKKDVEGSGGCRSMCCGRGFTSEVVEVKHRCHCKYYWCCYVKCKTCTKKVEVHRCR